VHRGIYESLLTDQLSQQLGQRDDLQAEYDTVDEASLRAMDRSPSLWQTCPTFWVWPTCLSMSASASMVAGDGA
jgi:hypothetical protein